MTSSGMHADVVIAGAGIAGISTAHHLAVEYGVDRVVICDPRPPLSLTSDKSTECYRNWWPGPDDTMVSFMNRSIDLLERWSTDSDNAINMSQRGYLYVTADADELVRMERSATQISGLGAGPLRIHSSDTRIDCGSSGDDQSPPRGADLFVDGLTLRQRFPYLSESAIGGLHVRRAGWLSAQQLGMWLLQTARERGVELVSASVIGVEIEKDRVRGVRLSSGKRFTTPVFVNAAGPMVGDVARLVGEDLPVHSEVHRKISFSDRSGVVPRDGPLLIWNDPQQLTWDSEIRSALESDGQTAHLVGPLLGGAHCRPDGPADATTVLGLWPYRTDVREPTFPIPDDPMYPEMVMRGLTALLPAMGQYLDRMPQPYVDGGYYTKTAENRPLIGELGPAGSFVIGALSGFGVMAAPAAGELIARTVAGVESPDYSSFLSPARYSDHRYRELVARMTDVGQL